LRPLGRKDGVNPLELEDLVTKITDEYVGIKKVKPRLKHAIEQFKVIREKFAPSLGASNPHELMRALEVQEVLDVAELHAQAALKRTESRMVPYHFRVDYPERDDEHWWRKVVVQQKVAGEMKCTLETMD